MLVDTKWFNPDHVVVKEFPPQPHILTCELPFILSAKTLHLCHLSSAVLFPGHKTRFMEIPGHLCLIEFLFSDSLPPVYPYFFLPFPV